MNEEYYDDGGLNLTGYVKVSMRYGAISPEASIYNRFWI